MDNLVICESLREEGPYKSYKVLKKNSSRFLVCKEFSYESFTNAEKQALVDRVNKVKDIRNKGVAEYVEKHLNKQTKKLHLLFEFIESPSLEELLCQTNFPLASSSSTSSGSYPSPGLKQKTGAPFVLTEKLVWSFLKQIVLVLHEIHRKKDGGIVHGSLSPKKIHYDCLTGEIKLRSLITHSTPFQEALNSRENSRGLLEKEEMLALGKVLSYLMNSSKKDVFSNELHRVLKWLSVENPHDRPGVEELLNVPNVSYLIREERYFKNQEALEIKKRELEEKAKELDLREMRMKESEERHGQFWDLENDLGLKGSQAKDRSSLKRVQEDSIQKSKTAPMHDIAKYIEERSKRGGETTLNEKVGLAKKAEKEEREGLQRKFGKRPGF